MSGLLIASSRDITWTYAHIEQTGTIREARRRYHGRADDTGYTEIQE